MMTRVLRAAASLAVVGLTAGAMGLASSGAAAAATEQVGDFTFVLDDADPAAGAVLHHYAGVGGVVQIPATVTIGGESHPVTSIGGSAFYDRSVTSVSIPDTVTSIGDSAFRKNLLTTVALPAGLTEIGGSAFGENSLGDVALPDAVTSIGEYAFDQNLLTAVTIGPNVQSIGARAFRYNAALREVVFTGPAPAITGRSDGGSFGPGEPTLYYPWRFGESATPGGYASPMWEDYPAQAVVTVSFETGGGGPNPAAQQVRPGAAPQRPADPTRAGFTFDGWASTATGERDFDFAGTPQADAVAHARWIAADSPDTPTGSTGSLGSLGSLFFS